MILKPINDIPHKHLHMNAIGLRTITPCIHCYGHEQIEKWVMEEIKNQSELDKSNPPKGGSGVSNNHIR